MPVCVIFHLLPIMQFIGFLETAETLGVFMREKDREREVRSQRHKYGRGPAPVLYWNNEFRVIMLGRKFPGNDLI